MLRACAQSKQDRVGRAAAPAPRRRWRTRWRNGGALIRTDEGVQEPSPSLCSAASYASCSGDMPEEDPEATQRAQQVFDPSPCGSSASVHEQMGLQHTTLQPRHLDIPWGLGTVVQVMVLWLLAYLALGQVVAPALMAAAGLEREALSARGTAFLHLGLDAGEVALTLGILWRCLRHYRPRERGLFALRWDGGRWLLPLVLVGAITFPIVNWIAEASVAWFSGEDGEVWSEALEVTLAEGDWVTNGAYITVIALCAPIWEEAIFRGFLLASLQRSLPAPGAALLSALVFAVAHVRPSTFAPLLLLGLVFAALYQRSNNLLPPIVLHSAWNLYVLWRMLVS